MKPHHVSIILRTLLAFLAIIVCLLVTDLLTYLHFARSTEAYRRSVHTFKVIDETQETCEALLQMELSLKCYLLTGRDDFLAAARTAQSAYERHYRDLVELTAESGRQQGRLALLDRDYQKWRQSTVKPFMEARPRPGEEKGSLAQEALLDGVAALKTLREVLLAMEQEERELLQLRQEELSLAKAKNKNIILFGVAFLTLTGASVTLWTLRALYLFTARQQQAEAELEKSKRYYENLLNSTLDPLQVVDRDLKIVYANDQFAEKLKSFGLAGDVLGKHLAEACPFLPAPVYAEYRTVFATGSPLFTTERTEIGGAACYTETTKALVFDEKGAVSHVITVVRDVSDRKAAEERAVRIEALQAMENERVRLARELHDEVGMALFALKLELQLLSAGLSGADKALQERLKRSIEKIDDTIKKVRHKTVSLRPPELEVVGLVPVLEALMDEMNKKTKMQASLEVKTELPKFSQEVENTLYRCVQEALLNAARHASACHLTVELAFAAGLITCKVKDDGVGFDPAACAGVSSEHLGLLGMKERVFLVRGTLELNSAPGEGTEIVITIPVDGT